MPALSRKSIALGLLLIGVGVIFGLVVASDLGWPPFGHAVPDALQFLNTITGVYAGTIP